MQLPDLSLLVIMAVFWATYWVLRIFVLKPLAHVLEEREAEHAAAAAALAAALEKQRNGLSEVERRLTDARKEAMAVRDAARAAAGARRQQAMDAAREKAQKALEAEAATLGASVAAAREELSRNARALAAEIASQALGRKVA